MRVSNYTHTYNFQLLDLFQNCLRKRLSKTTNQTNERNKKQLRKKIVAEKLNGRFATIGFIALIGAYLTTGQIIPGFV